MILYTMFSFQYRPVTKNSSIGLGIIVKDNCVWMDPLLKGALIQVDTSLRD